MKRYFFKADQLYPWLVAVLVASAVGVVVQQTILSLHLPKDLGLRLWVTGNPLGFALFYVAIATLLWRICFALRYQPYAPVSTVLLPTVTVVIPAFNEGSQILSTVRSIMASRYPLNKLQVICVDDGSKDDTWSWMQLAREEFSKSVQLIRQPKNGGKRKALLAGFALAKGQILVTIDSDSEVQAETLRHLVAPFVSDKRIGSVAGNVRVLNLDEGAIPKMMEVSFTNAFDFIRSGQSVYGGVFCTPGALSAYRRQLIQPLLEHWAVQSFMGKPANIGEDRALTNLVLASGHRVVYQRSAVVLTKMPTRFAGLRRMLLRWARSNVRENLVMFGYILKTFRPNDSGSNWIRLFCFTQILRMTLTEALKFGLIVQLLLSPVNTLLALAVGALIGAITPAVVHHLRYGGWFGFLWAVPFSFYWLVGLSWISLWGTFSASNSGWLTRDAANIVRLNPASALTPPVTPSPTAKAIAKAA
jgi:hyaluronan synthase